MTVYYANPGDNLTSKLSVLLPGDTLSLNDGVYNATDESHTMRFDPNNGSAVSGTSIAPITVKATNDGNAILDGNGVYEPVFITGCHYVVLQGLHVQNSGGGLVRVYSGPGGSEVHHITLKRISAHHAADGNNHIFDITNTDATPTLPYLTHDILVEDCAAWGPGRYMFISYRAHAVTFRRCFAYWNTINDDSTQEPRAAFGIYSADTTLLENCIGLHAIPYRVEGYDNYFESVWHTSTLTSGFLSDNTTIKGCIFYDNWNGYWLNNSAGSGHLFENSYFETPYTAATWTPKPKGDAFALNSGWTGTATIRNCTFRNSVNGLHKMTPTDASSVTLINNALVGNTTGMAGTAGHSYCGFYGNTANGTTIDGTDVTTDPGYDTATYGRGGALFVPATSPYHGAGSSGADIGATILYQYVDGIVTNTPLWPWPMEDRIVSELGQSPTYASGGGPWTTLAGLYQTAVYITAYATDTFTRANNASSWGTASDGVTTYDNLSGNGIFSISGNEGVYTGVTSTWFVPIAIGSTVTATADITYRASISDTMSRIGAFFNYTVPSSASLYRISFSGNTGDLRAEKRINGGTFATIGSPVTIAIITSNTFYNMRFQCLNGVLKAKVWNVGASEPSAWQLSATDGSPLAAGQFGFFIHEKTSGTIWKFDHLTATNGGYTSTRNATGRTKVSTASLHMANGKGRVKVVTTAQTVRNGMGRVLCAVPTIATTVGRITGATGTTTMILGTTTLTDGEAMAEVALSEVGTIVGVTMRYVSLTNFVRLRLTGTKIEVVEQTAAAFAILASYSFVPGIGTRYWLKLRATGSAVYGKVWRDGYVEPDWQVAATTTVVNDGQMGVSAALSSATATADFYLFQATSAITGIAPPTLSNFDVIARSGVEERFANQTRDIRTRARLVDVLDVVDIRVYAAERPPLIRKFPKS